MSLVGHRHSILHYLYQEFELVDPSKGRLKRFLIFEGLVANDLDLSEFPFGKIS